MDAYVLVLLVVLGIGCFTYLLLRKAPPRNFNDEKAILAEANVLVDYGKDQQAIEFLKKAAAIHVNRSQVASKLTQLTNARSGKKKKKRAWLSFTEQLILLAKKYFLSPIIPPFFADPENEFGLMEPQLLLEKEL